MNEARVEKQVIKGRNKRLYTICTKYRRNNAVKFLVAEGFSESKKEAEVLYDEKAGVK